MNYDDDDVGGIFAPPSPIRRRKMVIHLCCTPMGSEHRVPSASSKNMKKDCSEDVHSHIGYHATTSVSKDVQKKTIARHLIDTSLHALINIHEFVKALGGMCGGAPWKFVLLRLIRGHRSCHQSRAQDCDLTCQISDTMRGTSSAPGFS